MLLAIDIGNTNIVIGVYDQEKLVGHWRLSSTITRTSDESWIIVKLLCESIPLETSQIKGIIISSVVPNLTRTFSKMSEQYFNIQPVIVDNTLDTGIKILYETPENVGADRICNAKGGIEKYGGPLIVVDFGTATTFDVVTASAEYIGGIIMPGIEISAKFLHQRTAKLPRVALSFPKRYVGRTTIESIQSGLMYGMVEMVDGLVHRICEEQQEQMQVIATGGLAEVIRDQSETIHIYEPFLTLEGMRLIFERVHSKS